MFYVKNVTSVHETWENHLKYEQLIQEIMDNEWNISKLSKTSNLLVFLNHPLVCLLEQQIEASAFRGKQN